MHNVFLRAARGTETMKKTPGILLFLLLASFVKASQNADINALQAIRDTGEAAFERNDMKTLESLWVRDADAVMITALGTQYKGFPAIQRALLDLFAIMGRTVVETKAPFFTVDGNQASITMTYTWNVLPGTTFNLTERYRRANGDWKIFLSDGLGGTPGLRPKDEAAIKRLNSEVVGILLAKEAAAMVDIVTDDFVYTNSDGIRYHGWQQSAKILRNDVNQFANIALQSTALIQHRACAQYVLTLINGQTQDVQLTFVGPNWKLAQLNLKPDTEQLAVDPGNRAMVSWAKIKTDGP